MTKFNLSFPEGLSFEPEYSVPISPNFTAHIYRQKRVMGNWFEGEYFKETVEDFYVIALHNDTGETPDDYEDGRWVDSEFEAMVAVRRLARSMRDIEARSVRDEARLAREKAEEAIAA